MTTQYLIHRYAPRGACKALFSDKSPEVLLSGPAGTGKSRACLEKMHMMALMTKNFRGLIVRKTLASLGSTALVTWREHVAVESLEAGDVEYYGGSAEEPPQYRYRNGARIMIGGMDKPTRIMSSEYDAVYVQEAIELTEEDWESITTRLRNGRLSFQQIIADTNPAEPTHWLKVRMDKGAVSVHESRHEDNPTLFDEVRTPDGRTVYRVTERGADYISKLDALTGVRHSRYRKGLWVAAEGVIYEGFDPAMHVIDAFEPPADWTRWWVIDFGFVNPFTWQHWCEDPDGRLILYREIYHTRRTVDQHAADILATCTEPIEEYVHPEGQPRYAHHGRRWIQPKPRAIICDHDAGDRALLERELGLTTVAAVKGVADGIQVTEMRFKPAADGRPRLMIMKGALVERDETLTQTRKPCCLAEEIPGYVWDVGAGKKIKEQPLKENDHGCDGMRYLIAQRDLRPRGTVRFL